MSIGPDERINAPNRGNMNIVPSGSVYVPELQVFRVDGGKETKYFNVLGEPIEGEALSRLKERMRGSG